MIDRVDIIVNGEPHPWREQLRLGELIAELGLADKRVAVEVNNDIVPRSQHSVHTLEAGDKIEIIQAIGGG